jgi:glycosyltransferase involved in cell wall biosynthesis
MSADVFLFPSLYEGLGIALLEAQAADLICVVSDTIPELAVLTEKVRSVNLTESASVWSDIVEEMMGKYTVRRDRSELFTEKGYDINAQIKVLESFYMKAAEYER